MYRYVSRAPASSVIITKQMHTSAVSHGSYAHRTFLHLSHPPIALILLISFFLVQYIPRSTLTISESTYHIQLRIPLT